MNMEDEIKLWSDGVLTTLADEECMSPEFRETVLKELKSRPDAMIPLTEEMIRSAGTKGVGFTKKQLDVLCVDQTKGWIRRLVGTKVPSWKWSKFLSLKNKLAS